MFEDALDYDLEEYVSEMESMPEIEPKFPLLEESTIDITSIVLTNDTFELSVEPKYDEYTNDYNIVSLEQLTTCAAWRNYGFQTEFSNFNEDSISDNHEGCLDILFKLIPNIIIWNKE